MKQKRKCKSSKKNSKKSKGSALLLATILLFVVLGMVVSLSYITVMEQKMSGKTKSSVGAFFNADSGIEWALNKIVSSSGKISNVFGTSTPGNGIDCPDFGSGSPCKIYLLDTNGKVITDSNTDLSEVKAVRSVGTQGGETTRAIEAAVAQAVSGSGSLSGWCTEGGPAHYIQRCIPLVSSYPPKPPAFCDNVTNRCSCPSGYSVVMLGEYAGYEGSSQWRFIFSCYKN
jgi:Tfp pilus assembly protein PilX